MFIYFGEFYVYALVETWSDWKKTYIFISDWNKKLIGKKIQTGFFYDFNYPFFEILFFM